jgi:hypothetical protein
VQWSALVCTGVHWSGVEPSCLVPGLLWSGVGTWSGQSYLLPAHLRCLFELEYSGRGRLSRAMLSAGAVLNISSPNFFIILLDMDLVGLG